MAEMSFQFQGISNPSLLLTLLVAVALVLIGYGLWMSVRGRWPVAGACLVTVAIVGAAGAMLLAWGIVAGGAWMALLGVEIVAAVAVFYSTVYRYLTAARIVVLMALRCLGILALLLILFKPAMSFTLGGAVPRPYLPILVDRSGSMATTDEANLPSRYVQTIQMLALQRTRLASHFQPIWHHFGESFSTAESLDELSELGTAGKGTAATNLALAIRSAVADHDRASLPGVLVLTDGIHNASDDVLRTVAEAGVPIYPIAVGSTNEALSGRRNVQIVSADCPFEAVKNNVTTITCRVKMTSLATVPSEVRLLVVDDDTPLDAVRLWTDKNSETLTASLKWTPRDAAATGADVRKLRIAVAPHPGEAVAEDNSAELHVLVTEPRIRVLYIEGTIRPEFKFLRRLLDSDPNVQLMSMVREQLSRFRVRGSIGGVQLRALPTRPEDFAPFDVILLSDLDRTFLTRDQMSQLRKFVNDGGGLLMLGGHNSFGPGGYGQTEIEQILPVVVGPRSQPQETTPLLPQLTAAGRQHPIFEGIAGYFPGPGGEKPKADLAKLPELLGCVTVVRAKPAAAVLAIHPTRSNPDGPLVVLAVQRFGAGRTAAFTADTTWQWYLPLRALGVESPYEEFWGQLVRYLANVQTKARKTASSAVMRMDRQYVRMGRAVPIRVRVRDEKGQTPKMAAVACTVQGAEGGPPPEEFSLAFHPDTGLFEGDFRPKRTGQFLVRVLAGDASGAQLGEDEMSLVVAPHSAEMERLARNDTLLRQIAERSEGIFSGLSGLPDLVDQIVDRNRARTGPPPKVTVRRLYNFAILFVAFAALVTVEWLLRRRWQLR